MTSVTHNPGAIICQSINTAPLSVPLILRLPSLILKCNKLNRQFYLLTKCSVINKEENKIQSHLTYDLPTLENTQMSKLYRNPSHFWKSSDSFKNWKFSTPLKIAFHNSWWHQVTFCTSEASMWEHFRNGDKVVTIHVEMRKWHLRKGRITLW